MKKDKEFDNILDECLERLLVKGETIEQCLASYPEQAAELEPLLKTAVATKKALAIQPSPEFEAKARYRLHSALQEVKPKRGLSFLGWQPRWAVVVVIVLVLLLAGGGTGAAAGSSMPDNPLYPVKLATEQVQLTLARSNIDKAELYAKLADRRVAEIVYIANKGKPEKIEQTAQRLNNNLAMIASLPLAERGKMRAPMVEAPAPLSPQPAGEGTKGVPVQPTPQARLKILLESHAVNNPAVLQAALKTAPESAKPALRRAITTSAANYKKALETLD